MNRCGKAVDLGQQHSSPSFFARRGELHQRVRHGLRGARAVRLSRRHQEQQLAFTAPQVGTRKSIHEDYEGARCARRTATAVFRPCSRMAGDLRDFIRPRVRGPFEQPAVR
jgi:hypothetical protein